MGVVERKQRLFEGIVRLRRAERRGSPDPDIVAVRTMLEEDLGEAISRRLAARLLGVDHKALDRWIRSGDLPVVHTAAGRLEIPVADIVELFEAVSEARANGSRTRHYLEPPLTEGRRHAERIRLDELVDGVSRDEHARAERRSLAYHRALARRLRRPMVDDALRQVWKWREQRRIDPRYAMEWERVLRQPVAAVAHAISEDSDRGRDLRQNSPFAGMLSEAERRRINQEIA